MDKTTVSNEQPKKVDIHRICSCAGSAVQKIYTMDDKNQLVESGERNLQEEANASAVGCGVYGIIDRIARGAAVQLPDYSDGQYLDLTGMSDNTAAQALNAAKNSNEFLIKQAEATKKAQAETDDKLAQALKEIAELKAKLGGNQ